MPRERSPAAARTRVCHQPLPERQCPSRRRGAAVGTELRPSPSRHRALPLALLPPMRGRLVQRGAARSGIEGRDRGAASRSGIEGRHPGSGCLTPPAPRPGPAPGLRLRRGRCSPCGRGGADAAAGRSPASGGGRALVLRAAERPERCPAPPGPQVRRAVAVAELREPGAGPGVAAGRRRPVPRGAAS